MRTPTFLRAPAIAVGASLVLGACLAPGREEEKAAKTGSLADVGEMMAAGGAASVAGTVEDGLKVEPEAMGDLADPTFDAAEEELAAEAFATEAERDWAEEYEDDPYVRFGERIILREVDGRTFITKPYNLPSGRPAKVVQLMEALRPFDVFARPAEGELPPLDPGRLEYQILAGLDDEYYTNFATFDSQMAPPKVTPLADLLVVTATPRLLADFEDFLDLFAGGGVPQIELEAKIIEISETDTTDIGMRADFLFGATNFVSAASVNLPNFAGSTEALLTLGAVQDGVAFDGILEAIQGWQNVSIDSRPKTVVRAGGVAHIEARTEIPFLQFKTLDAKGFFTTSTEYKKIGVELWISPRMVGSNTLALDIQVEGSQRTGSQAILSTSSGEQNPISIDVPIIAYRTAKTVVHLEPGQTLVIGGLTQEREQEITNKIPLLGDLPLLGWLFRSKYTSKERQHVIFAVSPRIIQRGDFESDL